MILSKKIIFVTSTRADFGKLKSLIKILKNKKFFEIYIVVTGMHLISKFGNTYREVEKTFGKKIIKFKNQIQNDSLEMILAKTTSKFSKIVKKIKPDLIVIHGDRVEALSCALTGSLNHILTAHIEGGEISGTIDDTIRHAVTKLSHIHFVGSNSARKRIIKMGEIKSSIFNIGSPDLDVILKKKLPTLKSVQKRYSINFKKYCILIWHPVTSNLFSLKNDTIKVLDALKKLNRNVVVIYPNNDPGCEKILKIYNELNKKRFKILKSLRFENFISLLKNSEFIFGNSSSAIYEAPILGIPSFNIGDRQHKRVNLKSIKNLDTNNLNLKIIEDFLKNYKPIKKNIFGGGNSDKKFLKITTSKSFWGVSTQKFFNENKLY
jgi:UDP-N-acetylglucosamine 2-epimerase (hydrolysing)